MAHTFNFRPSLFNGLLYRSGCGVFLMGCITVCVFCFSCATASETKPAQPSAGTSPPNMEATWGIRPESVRLAANGLMVDFRYRVTDSGKASALLNEKQLKPRLVDMASRLVLTIPELEKVGAMRTSFKNIVKNKVYFMMFANPNKLVKHGSKIAIVIGDFKANDLVVQ